MSVLTDMNFSPKPFRHLFCNDALQVGEAVHVHEGGFERVVAANVDIHHELIAEDAKPHPLQASWVADTGVLPRLPDDCLRAAGMRSFAQRAHNIINLIYGFKRDPFALLAPMNLWSRISEQPLVIGVFPLAGFWVNPMVVNSIHDFQSIHLQLNQSARNGFVNSWLSERIANHNHCDRIATQRVAFLVILCRDLRSFAPCS